ncbi:hypothetical protein KIPB_000487 [Kipferlia bialata]|uniref:Uncharacterized protein n=1 Tax=Kipferlia bialata TaxID=797122 RepID=A0A9K3CME4_9EUKA|nr:hypothetical protein KIPB_000487 [Kipferlia bialata]|eukprot:g487.t1
MLGDDTDAEFNQCHADVFRAEFEESLIHTLKNPIPRIFDIPTAYPSTVATEYELKGQFKAINKMQGLCFGELTQLTGERDRNPFGAPDNVGLVLVQIPEQEMHDEEDAIARERERERLEEEGYTL